MRRFYPLMLAALALVLAPSSAQTASAAPPAVTAWPNWRGPAYNGTSPATGLPDKLSPDSNLLWTAPLPGLSNATPVIAGGHVYLSAFDASTKKLLALSVEVATGKLEWSHEIANAPGVNARNTYATPSATVDDHGPYFLFGTSDLLAYDTAGKVRWQRKLTEEFGKIANDWVYSSSTLLLNDTLFVQVLQRSDRYGKSFLVAINAADGKTKWRIDRPSDALGESKDAYTTPLPLFLKDATQILLLGGDCLTAHDPDTGKELWRFGGFNPLQKTDWRIIPNPVADADRAYITVARGKTTLAIKTGGAGGGGDITSTHKAWALDNLGSDSPSPTLSAGVLYILDSDRKTLTAIDAATGAKKASALLGGNAAFYASPTIADGKIYCLSEFCEVIILSADTMKILSRTTLDDKGSVRSTISVIDGKVFVRTTNKLWCFGSK